MSREQCQKCEGWGEVPCTRCKGRKPAPFFHRYCPRCDDEGFLPCDCDRGTVEQTVISGVSSANDTPGDVDVFE